MEEEMADNERQPATDQDIEGILAPELPPELEGGQPTAPSAPEPKPPQEPVDERLNKALSTIEALQREVVDLRRRPAQVVQQVPYTGEPRLEMEEVFPGRSIPKDPSQRHIRIQPEDLIRLGWNDDPARAINTLANAFFHHIVDVIPALTMAYQQESERSRSVGAQRQQSFYQEFPDLRDFSDLAQIVEQQALNEGRIQGLSQAEWNREIGGRVRQRIAAMRGISVDQYQATVGQSGTSAPRSRAVTAPPARGSRAATAGNDQQREMEDLIEGRL
jgi:hypothetical protein